MCLMGVDGLWVEELVARGFVSRVGSRIEGGVFTF